MEQESIPAGFITKGTTVESRGELASLLEEWLRRSEQPTIGDRGTYGRTAWVRLRIGDHVVALNADTKRSAVEHFLQHVSLHGDAIPWHVVANRNGRVNKVNYVDDERGVEGWYAYLQKRLAAPRSI